MTRAALIVGSLFALAGCGGTCHVDTPAIGDLPNPATAGATLEVKFDVHTNGECNNDGRFIKVSVLDSGGQNHPSTTALSQDTSNGLTFHGDTFFILPDAGVYTFDVTVGDGLAEASKPLTVQ